MKISYAITVCNEIKEITALLTQLRYRITFCNREDEIVVIFDSKNGTKEVKNYIKNNKSIDKLVEFKFDNDFSKLKNKLTSSCKGDYIFQIDADELIHDDLVKILPMVLEENPTIDVFRVPRINIVKGITQQHLIKWAWAMNSEGWINFPDYQWRCYRNSPKIKWKNKVHEVLTGYDEFGELPPVKEFCLIHEKTIERQEKQNEYYNTLQ